jgi:beta-lactamase class A
MTVRGGATRCEPGYRVVSRRQLLLGTGTALLAAAASRGAPRQAILDQVSLLENRIGGRIGLAALGTQTGIRVLHRADERFAMCSTFKLMLAALVLSRVDSRELRFDQSVRYSRDDLLPHSPVTEAHVAEGALPLADIAQAVVEESDNTAANLLLTLSGGPQGYTGFVRALGDHVTRLDRVELALNSNLPGDMRDTTTPNAMLANMQRVLLGRVLSAASRERLLGWLRDSSTGRERLRAQLPHGWTAGDKTGTGNGGACNDLAIFWPPKGAPLLVACYLSGSPQPGAALDGAHARIGSLIANALT